MQIGREKATWKRIVAVAAGLGLAVAVWWVWWPSAASCERGDAEACVMRAWASMLPAYIRIPGLHDGKFVTVDWPGADGRTRRTTVEMIPALEHLRPHVEPKIGMRLVTCGTVFFAGIFITYLLFWLSPRRKSKEKTEVLRGVQILDETQFFENRSKK